MVISLLIELDDGTTRGIRRRGQRLVLKVDASKFDHMSLILCLGSNTSHSLVCRGRRDQACSRTWGLRVALHPATGSWCVSLVSACGGVLR